MENAIRALENKYKKPCEIHPKSDIHTQTKKEHQTLTTRAKVKVAAGEKHIDKIHIKEITHVTEVHIYPEAHVVNRYNKTRHTYTPKKHTQ